jgi:hypothetical protein
MTPVFQIANNDRQVGRNSSWIAYRWSGGCVSLAMPHERSFFLVVQLTCDGLQMAPDLPHSLFSLHTTNGLFFFLQSSLKVVYEYQSRNFVARCELNTCHRPWLLFLVNGNLLRCEKCPDTKSLVVAFLCEVTREICVHNVFARPTQRVLARGRENTVHKTVRDISVGSFCMMVTGCAACRPYSLYQLQANPSLRSGTL